MVNNRMNFYTILTRIDFATLFNQIWTVLKTFYQIFYLPVKINSARLDQRSTFRRNYFEGALRKTFIVQLEHLIVHGLISLSSPGIDKQKKIFLSHVGFQTCLQKVLVESPCKLSRFGERNRDVFVLLSILIHCFLNPRSKCTCWLLQAHENEG